jgi:hypothetical protein
MIMDKFVEFADAVSVAAAAGTANIGSQIDMSVVRDLGQGQPVYLVVNVDTEIITGGVAGTIKFQLVSDSTASIATNGTQTIHAESATYVTDDAGANDVQMNAGEVPFHITLPIEGVEYEQFLGVQAVIATTTVTAGAINAFLTLDPYGAKHYPDASN